MIFQSFPGHLTGNNCLNTLSCFGISISCNSMDSFPWLSSGVEVFTSPRFSYWDAILVFRNTYMSSNYVLLVVCLLLIASFYNTL